MFNMLYNMYNVLIHTLERLIFMPEEIKDINTEKSNILKEYNKFVENTLKGYEKFVEDWNTDIDEECIDKIHTELESNHVVANEELANTMKELHSANISHEFVSSEKKSQLLKNIGREHITKVPLVVSKDNNRKIFNSFIGDCLIGSMCYIDLKDGPSVSGFIIKVSEDNSYLTLADFDAMSFKLCNYDLYASDIISKDATMTVFNTKTLSLDIYKYNDMITNSISYYFNIDAITPNSFVTLLTPNNTNELSVYVWDVTPEKLTIHTSRFDIERLQDLCIFNVNTTGCSDKFKVSLQPTDFKPCINVIVEDSVNISSYTPSAYNFSTHEVSIPQTNTDSDYQPLPFALDLFFKGYEICRKDWKDGDYIWWDSEKSQIMDNNNNIRKELDTILTTDSFWRIVGRR